MSGFDRDAWEERWARTPVEHGERLGQRPPNAHLVSEIGALAPGRALDAGCGHGAEALWLAARGWRVTAVDFAATALAHAREADVERRVDWVEADLGTWTPPAEAYDLVVSLFVHVAGPVDAFVRRLASGVAAGGTLLLAGHRPAPGQTQVSLDTARAALDPAAWELLLAEERPRATSGVDDVVRARRR